MPIGMDTPDSDKVMAVKSPRKHLADSILLKTGDLTLLTTKEVMAILKIRRTKLYSFLATDRIPAPIRLGRELRWMATTIQAWLEQGCPAADKMVNK